MNGRKENNKKTETEILKVLSTSHKIAKDYYYSLTDKTMLTKNVYVRNVIKFLDFIKYSENDSIFADLKPSDINRFLESVKINKDGKEKSPSAIANILYSVSSFFDFLEIEGLIENNICKKIKAPHSQQEKDIVAMTIDEIHEVENNINKLAKEKWKNRDMLLFVLGCTTGLRVSSIQEINIEDIDFNNNELTVVEKGNKTRTIPLGLKTIKLIQSWMTDRKNILGNEITDALFISDRKSRLSTNTIRRCLEKYTSTLAKKITPHKMRSTCATTLYEATGDIYMVKDMLGHKNIANTMKYARMSDQKRIEATNIMNQIIG